MQKVIEHFLESPYHRLFKKYKWICQETSDAFLSICLISYNYNDMMHGSWDMEYDKQSFFSFWTISCHFTLLTAQKIKILKKF